MKKVLILLVATTLLVMMGCSKAKTCNCKMTQNIPYVGPTVTNTTATIEKGSCSDLNTTTTTTVEGMTITQTMECVEQ